MLGDCVSRQNKHLTDCLINIKTMLARRRFLDVITDPVDDIAGAIGIRQDTAERFSDLPQLWPIFVQGTSNNDDFFVGLIVGRRDGDFSS
jgi:hypothetical protein